MEVSRRRSPATLAPARSVGASTAVAVAATLATALIVALSQPVRAPWWVYADADASYTASGLNLMAGKRSFYLDHPGMPLQDLMAITFEGRYLFDRALGHATGISDYRQAQMRKIGDSVAWWRAYAIVFYVLGAGIAFFVLARLLGHWGWGLAGGLLWIGAPGLAPMSIQYRPDVLLCALALLTGYLIMRAAERRDAVTYTAAAFLLGFTMSIKIHAVGLLATLLFATVWRPVQPAWETRLREGLTAGTRRYWLAFATTAAAWIGLMVTFNRGRLPPRAIGEEHHLLMVLLAVFAAFLVAAAAVRELTASPLGRRVLDPFYAVLGGALLLGIALPGSLFPEDGLQMLISIKDALTGGGVNQGVSAFNFSIGPFAHWPLKQAAVLFLVGALGAVLGAVRRNLWPAAWFAGAALLAAMASARLATTHYFAPAYVLSLPPALWLCRQQGRRLGALGAAALTAYVLVPQLTHLEGPADRARFAERQEAVIASFGNALLQERQVAVVDIGAPTAASRYNGYVEHFVQDPVPDHDRRFLEDYARSLDIAKAEGLQFRYYIGVRGLGLTRSTRLRLAWGDYTAKPLPAFTDRSLGLGTLKLVAGPGISYPYDHPDARYDPWTGYFKDRAGKYWSASGAVVTNPARRTYIPASRLWLDAYGDFWNAKGELVKSNPSLRTAP